MCTHITLSNKLGNIVSARTMDFSLELEPKVGIVPRNYLCTFNHEQDLTNHYAFVGLTKEIDNYIFADGVNEHGLSCASLYFEGYASYNDNVVKGKLNLSPHEVVNWLLLKCKNVEQVEREVNNLNLVNDELEFIGGVTPLHWVVVDAKGKSIIIEPLKEGIKISENIIGVFANSPDIDWHMTNLRNYIGLSTEQVSPREIDGITFKAFGQGSGTFGLPGDYTPPSRFVRTVFNKLSCKKGDTKEGLIVSAINILNAVTIPMGSVITPRNTIDYTQYIAYMSLEDREYYFKTYYNNGLTKVSLKDFNLNSSEIILKDIGDHLIYKNISN